MTASFEGQSRESNPVCPVPKPFIFLLHVWPSLYPSQVYYKLPPCRFLGPDALESPSPPLFPSHPTSDLLDLPFQHVKSLRALPPPCDHDGPSTPSLTWKTDWALCLRPGLHSSRGTCKLFSQHCPPLAPASLWVRVHVPTMAHSALHSLVPSQSSSAASPSSSCFALPQTL